MRVDESIVIFGPIFQVGCASASSRVTSPSSSSLRPRKGPPDAVMSSRATSSGRLTEFKHWWTAQCSESTGTISAPGGARARWTIGAPAISDSLLARARRRPDSSAAMVTGSPANPTTPFTTMSAAVAAAIRPSGPATTSVPAGTSSASFVASPASPIATSAGWRA